MNTPRNPSARNAKIGVLAISAVALAATGGAYAASKLHGSAGAAKSGLSTGWYVSSKTAATHMGGGPGHGFGMRGGMRHGPGDELAAAATYLGVSQDTLMSSLQSGKTLAQVANTTSGKSAAGLVDALVAAEKDEIAAAVKAGNLTQAQADQITANLKDRMTNRVNGQFQRGGPGGMGHGPGGMGHGPGHELAAASTYLGVSQDSLMSSLQSGKTLAQVANTTSGKSAAGLVDALVAAEKDEIAAAVKAGNLTQAQADQITANLKDRVTNLVNGVRPMHPDGPPPSAGWGGNGMRANHI